MLCDDSFFFSSFSKKTCVRRRMDFSSKMKKSNSLKIKDVFKWDSLMRIWVKKRWSSLFHHVDDREEEKLFGDVIVLFGSGEEDGERTRSAHCALEARTVFWTKSNGNVFTINKLRCGWKFLFVRFFSIIIVFRLPPSNQSGRDFPLPKICFAWYFPFRNAELKSFLQFEAELNFWWNLKHVYENLWSESSKIIHKHMSRSGGVFFRGFNSTAWII